MWDTVGVIAAVVVIILLFQILDITDALKDRIRGRMPREDLEGRISRLEKLVEDLYSKIKTDH